LPPQLNTSLPVVHTSTTVCCVLCIFPLRLLPFPSLHTNSWSLMVAKPGRILPNAKLSSKSEKMRHDFLPLPLSFYHPSQSPILILQPPIHSLSSLFSLSLLPAPTDFPFLPPPGLYMLKDFSPFIFVENLLCYYHSTLEPWWLCGGQCTSTRASTESGMRFLQA